MLLLDWLVESVGPRIDQYIGPNKGVESVESKTTQNQLKLKTETKTSS